MASLQGLDAETYVREDHDKPDAAGIFAEETCKLRKEAVLRESAWVRPTSRHSLEKTSRPSGPAPQICLRSLIRGRLIDLQGQEWILCMELSLDTVELWIGGMKGLRCLQGPHPDGVSSLNYRLEQESQVLVPSEGPAV